MIQLPVSAHVSLAMVCKSIKMRKFHNVPDLAMNNLNRH